MILSRSNSGSGVFNGASYYITGSLNVTYFILFVGLLIFIHSNFISKRLPKIMIHWKPEGKIKRGRPRKTWKDGIYTANNRRQWDMKVGRRRQTF
jgi:hypothetical protein